MNIRSLMTAAAFAAVAITSTITEAKAQNREVWLYSGQSTLISGNFAAGEAIYGSCDSDCYDMDLFLYNSQGQLVSQDTASDAAPVLVAPYTGYFEINVAMPNCAHSQGCAAWVSSDYGF